MINLDQKIYGYRRDNNRVGIRNYVVILPVDDISNAACEAVSNNIRFPSNWKPAAVTGLLSGKRFVITKGDIQTIADASKAAYDMVHYASGLQREACDISEIWVSTKCGESDTTSGFGANPTVGNAFDKLYEKQSTLLFGETSEITGGEHLVKARCANDAVADQFMFMFNRYQDMIERWKTDDLSDSQPTKGNIEGGLTTIEEKALGNIQKIGKDFIHLVNSRDREMVGANILKKKCVFIQNYEK